MAHDVILIEGYWEQARPGRLRLFDRPQRSQKTGETTDSPARLRGRAQSPAAVGSPMAHPTDVPFALWPRQRMSGSTASVNSAAPNITSDDQHESDMPEANAVPATSRSRLSRHRPGRNQPGYCWRPDAAVSRRPGDLLVPQHRYPVEVGTFNTVPARPPQLPPISAWCRYRRPNARFGHRHRAHDGWWPGSSPCPYRRPSRPSDSP